MPRVKRGTKRRDRRKKILEQASGYFLTKSKLYQAAQEAVTKARSGDGPFFLEMKSYRWRAHTEAMTVFGETRPLDEVESWKKRDPLVLLEKRLLEEKTATKSQLEAIDKEARAVIDDAVNFALSSPLPKPEDALADVFSD